MSYTAHTDRDIQEMLAASEKSSLEELFSEIPVSLRGQTPAITDTPLSEYDVLKKIKSFAGLNKPLNTYNAFVGGGCYAGYIPSTVKHIASKPEFYTAYTPYQPEISQGILQSIYEYQSFICLLTGMDVTSASLYDGASSVAEAVLMGLRARPAKKVLLSQSLHPEYARVVSSYLAPLSVTLDTLPWDRDGRIDREILRKKTSSGDHAAIVVQTPNFLGILEDIKSISARCKEKDITVIVAVANPISLGLFQLPSEQIDIVCGNGGPLGGDPYWGGDTFGFVAAKERFMRNLPGRIVGRTVDKNDTPCFVLTLQAREQHIKREHATSNICSNQALNALKAAVYLSTVGEEGFKRLALANFYNTQYLREGIRSAQAKGKFEVLFSDCVFNEFVLDLKNTSVASLYKKCAKKGILPGIPLKPYYRQLKNALLICATETKTTEEMDAFIAALSESC